MVSMHFFRGTPNTQCYTTKQQNPSKRKIENRLESKFLEFLEIYPMQFRKMLDWNIVKSLRLTAHSISLLIYYEKFV